MELIARPPAGKKRQHDERHREGAEVTLGLAGLRPGIGAAGAPGSAR